MPNLVIESSRDFKVKISHWTVDQEVGWGGKLHPSKIWELWCYVSKGHCGVMAKQGHCIEYVENYMNREERMGYSRSHGEVQNLV